MHLVSRSLILSLATASLVATAACSDDATTPSEQEVITTVTLTFTPAGGGTPVVVAYDDPDGDGGAAPTIDALGLVAGTTYDTTVRFQNKLETPAEEITDEIRDEADQHQLFFTGSAVDGPATANPGAPLVHAYADTDANLLPIGLANTFTVGSGTPGELTVTLRHMPPVNGAAVKTAAAAMTVRDGGFAALGGETDAQVTFQVAIAVP